MGKLTQEIINKIIELYKNGMGSTTISKNLGIKKHYVLTLLKSQNLIRNKKIDKSNYKDFWFKDNKWYGYRKCPKCDENILCYAQTEYFLFRNIKTKTKKECLCKKCYSEFYSGKNNSFFGKKHKKSSINKISKSRKGKYSGDIHHTKKEKYKRLSKKIMESNWDKGILNREFISEQIKNNIRLGKLTTQNKSKKEVEIKNFLINAGFDVTPYFKVDTKICDFYLPKLNLILEYYGDYWHCNPNKYGENYFNGKKGLKAKEIWEMDNNRLELIKNYGYNLEVIWESELKYNNNKIIEILQKHGEKNK